MNRVRVAGLLAVSALVTSCGLFGGGGGDPTTAPPSNSSSAPSTPSPTGTAVYANPVAQKPFELGEGSTKAYGAANVYGVYRQGEYAVLVFGAALVGGDVERLRLFSLLEKGSAPVGYDDAKLRLAASGVTLVDTAQAKVHLVALDAESGGECVCARDFGILQGATSIATATFKAPPAESKTVDVSLANLGYIPDVPVTDGEPPPMPERPSGGGVPPFIPIENASDDEPARADVVDLETPSANLDLSVTQQRDRVVLAGDVLFEFNKATLKRDARPRLLDAARILRKEAKGEVKVNGYTDSKGSDSYNLSLSKRRAETVKKALDPLLKGSGITLVTKGYGEASPVAPNTTDGRDNPGGRKLNRRVEIVFTK